MSPQEKAKELFDKMYSVKTMYDAHNITIHEAKQCTLIAVDEIIDATLNGIDLDLYYGSYNENCKEYWQEVKQEIEKL